MHYGAAVIAILVAFFLGAQSVEPVANPAAELFSPNSINKDPATQERVQAELAASHAKNLARARQEALSEPWSGVVVRHDDLRAVTCYVSRGAGSPLSCLPDWFIAGDINKFPAAHRDAVYQAVKDGSK